MQFKSIYILLSLTLASCTMNPLGNNLNKENMDIRIHATQSSYTLPDTKASVPAGSMPTSRGITLAAYYNSPDGTSDGNYVWNLPMTYNAGTWNCDAKWPSSGSLDLLAFSAGSLSLSGITYDSDVSAGVSVTFPNNASSQQDLLFASLDGAVNGSTPELEFSHAFARITFTADSTTPRDVSEGVGVTINSITLNGVYCDGTIKLNADGTVVYNTSSSTTGTQDIALPGLSTYDVPGTAINLSANEWGIGNNGILIPPQAMTSFTVEYTEYNAGVGTAMTLTKELSGTWQANNSYNYKLQFRLGDPVTSFGGMIIAPGPLTYTATGFDIASSWDQSSFNGTHGKNTGSTYFNFIELGTGFDSRGNSFTGTSGNIDNAVTIDGYRIPTKADWEKILTSDYTVRLGATVNGQCNVHYAVVRMTGSLGSLFSNPYGLLIFPDNKKITGRAITYYDRTSVNTSWSQSDIQNYVDQGCIYLLCGSSYSALIGSWTVADLGNNGYFWSATSVNNNNAYATNIRTIDTAVSDSKTNNYYQVMLVKDVS